MYRKDSRYPNIHIQSKNELAKQISGPTLPYSKALTLINSVVTNFDSYWHDSKMSKPAEGKYVRSAVSTPLGDLLKLIDRKVLKPHDVLVPDFLFGGLSGRTHIQAAGSLIGQQGKRTLLKLDLKRFFEQVHKKRVFYFFYTKCGCSVRAARLLARLCCVPVGKKGNGSSEEVLARGFATSSRLAVWCNLDAFIDLNWKMKRALKGYDPRVAVFVDDIGITASRIELQIMQAVAVKAESILAGSDKGQPLVVNQNKTKITSHKDRPEHLGLILGRKRLSLSPKTRSMMDRVKNRLNKNLTKSERQKLKQARASYAGYKKQVKEAPIKSH